MKRKLTIFATFVIVAALSAVAAYATITFDSGTGTGFVGKGDVQYTLGWNNAQLQANAANVRIRALSTSGEVSEWICDRDAGPQTQERSQTTTTTTQGVVTTVGRERTQITGFILSGYTGTPEVETETDGPALNSCPTGWTSLGATTTQIPGTTSLEVSGDGGITWTTLLEKPVI